MAKLMRILGRSQAKSAAAALGGKISAVTIRMPITNVYDDGDYTGTVHIGSQKTPCKVLLDTGSSSFAVDGNHFNVELDNSAVTTDLAQEVEYEDKSHWVGAVIGTTVTAGTGKQSAVLKDVNVAVAYHETRSMFKGCDGILGLAYTKLNDAYRMSGPTIPPKFTYNQVQAGRKTYLEPYFTQLESAGMVANKFGFYAKRSTVSKATKDPLKDPENHGFLILGGGEENHDLYTGEFQVARVVDDLYYNTNLKFVRVGKGQPIPVPAPTKASGNKSNSIVDSGTQDLLLDQNLFDEITGALSAAQADALNAVTVPMSKLDLSTWPTITFVLEGALGKDVELDVTPETYWQTNSPKRGYAEAMISGDDGDGDGSSTLGLPLINSYFTVFDRSVDKGLGVISFAKIK